MASLPLKELQLERKIYMNKTCMLAAYTHGKRRGSLLEERA
jgi:hypothetical protein